MGASERYRADDGRRDGLNGRKYVFFFSFGQCDSLQAVAFGCKLWRVFGLFSAFGGENGKCRLETDTFLEFTPDGLDTTI